MGRTIICTTCEDTHWMQLGDRKVMCTHCPTPCDRCRGGGGAFCVSTPCACACHTRGDRSGRVSVDANDVRRARLFLLLHPDDCDPPHGLDLQPGGRDEAKVEHLAATFKRWGFSLDAPVLVGYPLDGRVQLLTGTHRHEAARRAGILLPVALRLRSDVEARWGTDRWPEVIADVSLRSLKNARLSSSSEAKTLVDSLRIRVDPRSFYQP